MKPAPVDSLKSGAATESVRLTPGSREATNPPSLRVCPLGSAVEVQWIDLEDGERTRLRELGIREGALLHVVNCGAFGAKVVALGSDRFAIDGRTCACIAVLPHVYNDGEHAVVGSRDLQAVSVEIDQVVSSSVGVAARSVLHRAALRLAPAHTARA